MPEIDRVLFLKGGRLVADGRREAMLTAARLSDLFDTPVAVDVVDGYVYAPAGAAHWPACRRSEPRSGPQLSFRVLSPRPEPRRAT